MNFRREIKKVAVYGGGVIGSGWAINFIMADLPVTVFDVNDACIENTKKNIITALDFYSREDIAVLTKEQAKEKFNLLTFTTDVKTAVADADFIQENTPEKLEIKQSVIATIEEFNDSTLIASSTSGLLVTDIAAKAKHPERIVAGHPFNPVNLMPLVEVCPGEKSDPDAVKFAYETYLSIKKKPVILTQEIPGFLVNRVQFALNREVQDLVTRGICSVEDIDTAVIYGMGLRLGLIGPHMIFELAGGNGGIEEFLTKYGAGENKLGIATWLKRPEEYPEIAIKGAKEELSHRTEFEGQNRETLAAYRDKGLVELLKFHELF